MNDMQSNLVFSGSIQELSFDEICFVSGGNIGDGSGGGGSPWDDALLGGQRDRTVSGWSNLEKHAGRWSLILEGVGLIYEGSKAWVELLAKDEKLANRVQEFERITGDSYFGYGGPKY